MRQSRSGGSTGRMSRQRVLLRKGHFGEVTHGGAGFTAEVRGLSHLLEPDEGPRIPVSAAMQRLAMRAARLNLEMSAFRETGSIVTV